MAGIVLAGIALAAFLLAPSGLPAAPSTAEPPAATAAKTAHYPALVPDAPPRRVVSINLCTDQLAMLLAAPGQLISVSQLAQDPLVSLMSAQAGAMHSNHARAEEIYLLQPDLVLAGSYSDGATLDMLRRLGIRVETLPPANSLQDVREGLARIGDLLHRQAQAQAMIAGFDADLAAIRQPDMAQLAASFDANSYSAGANTLAGDVMRAAGWELVPDRLGRDGGGPLPLELLIIAAPDLIVTGTRYAHPSRAEEILDHPALRNLTAARRSVPDRDWICGLPQIAATTAGLAAPLKAQP